MNELMEAIERLGNPNVMVVGDFILDRYVWGQVSRVSDEAPIPILKESSEEIRLGGAGSVVNNVRTLGANVTCCGVLGRDSAGDVFREKLRSIGVDDSAVIVDHRRPTTVKTRYLGRGQQMLAKNRLQREGEHGPDLLLLVVRKNVHDPVDGLYRVRGVQGGEGQMAGLG